MDAAYARLVHGLKNEETHGIEGEASSAWDEAAAILQAVDHGLAETLRSQLRSSAWQALRDLTREQRVAVWLASDSGRSEFRDLEPSQWAALDPATLYAEALDEPVEELAQWLESSLLDHPLHH